MHVFLVHSSITYLVAREIIRNKKLITENVVFITDRNFDMQKYCTEFRVLSFKYNWKSNPFFISKNPFHYYRTLRGFDIHIQEITNGQEYFVYLPHTHNTIFQVLTTHPKCKGFSYIEEGTLSFLTKEEMPDSLKSVPASLLLRICYLFRIKALQEPFHNDYLSAYHITPGAFPFLDRKEKLDLVVEDNKGYGNMNKAHIIVYDPASKYNLTTTQAYVYAIISLLEKLIRYGNRTIYYKLHPEHIKPDDQDAFLYKELMRLYSEKAGIDFVELSQDVSLEEISIFARNLTFYISISSVGIYAKINNHNVITFSNKISEVDKGFEKTTSRLKRWLENYDNLV